MTTYNKIIVWCHLESKAIGPCIRYLGQTTPCGALCEAQRNYLKDWAQK